MALDAPSLCEVTLNPVAVFDEAFDAVKQYLHALFHNLTN
jgi:hypothetical protein